MKSLELEDELEGEELERYLERRAKLESFNDQMAVPGVAILTTMFAELLKRFGGSYVVIANNLSQYDIKASIVGNHFGVALSTGGLWIMGAVNREPAVKLMWIEIREREGNLIGKLLSQRCFDLQDRKEIINLATFPPEPLDSHYRTT